MPSRPACCIKPHQWQQHQVERPGLALPCAVNTRFEDAKTVGDQCFVGCDALEHHFGLRPGTEHGQVRPCPGAASRSNKRGSISTISGQVECDVFGAAKQRMLCQLSIQATGCQALRAGRKFAAGIAQQSAKLRAGRRRRFGHGGVLFKVESPDGQLVKANASTKLAL